MAYFSFQEPKYKRLIKLASFNTFFVCCITLLLFPFYTGGDQEFYNNAYELVRGENVASAFLAYRTQINSIEPLHFLLTWVFSNAGVPKIFFVTLFNGYLAYVITIFLARRGASSFFITFLLLLNFYFLVLYIPAERLKVAMCFFVTFLIVRRKFRIFFLLFAMLSHVSILIFFVVFAFEKFLMSFKGFNWKVSRNSIFLFLIFIAVAFLLREHIFNKILGYFELAGGNIFSGVKLVAILSIPLFFSRNKVASFSALIVLSLAAFYLGPGRVNMFAYFYFVLLSIRSNSVLLLFSVLVNLYFLFPSFYFVYKTLVEGTTVNLYG